MSKSKKQEQLGMNPGTASYRLVKDILFFFIEQNNYVCYHCDKAMTRDNFSIEHLEPWLDSKSPKELYFDLNNIGFSHLKCNISASRPNKGKHPSVYSYLKGCRCKDCTKLHTERKRKYRKNKKF